MAQISLISHLSKVAWPGVQIRQQYLGEASLAENSDCLGSEVEVPGEPALVNV